MRRMMLGYDGFPQESFAPFHSTLLLCGLEPTGARRKWATYVIGSTLARAAARRADGELCVVMVVNRRNGCCPGRPSGAMGR